jgi:hypothetical protein
MTCNNEDEWKVGAMKQKVRELADRETKGKTAFQMG